MARRAGHFGEASPGCHDFVRNGGHRRAGAHRAPAYRPVLEVHGWAGLQDELNRLSKEGKWHLQNWTSGSPSANSHVMNRTSSGAADSGHTDRRISALTSANAGGAGLGRVTTARRCGRCRQPAAGASNGVRSRYLGGSGRLTAARMVFWSLVRAERWATRPSAVAKVTRCAAGRVRGEVAPGVAGAGFRDAGEQQCQPTQLDVCADAVFAVVVDRARRAGSGPE